MAAEQPRFDDLVRADCHRFVCTPIPDVQKRLEEEEKARKAEMTNLAKKEDYLEMTYKNSSNAIEEALKRQG
jgi:prefoldin subunit 1